jgi:hypothetical protein
VVSVTVPGQGEKSVFADVSDLLSPSLRFSITIGLTFCRDCFSEKDEPEEIPVSDWTLKRRNIICQPFVCQSHWTRLAKLPLKRAAKLVLTTSTEDV